MTNTHGAARHSMSVICAMTVALLLPVPGASAQDRRGMTFEFLLGPAWVVQSGGVNNDPVVELGIAAGGMVSKKVQLAGFLSAGWAGGCSGGECVGNSEALVAGTFQYWLTSRIWAGGGAGLGKSDTSAIDGISGETVGRSRRGLLVFGSIGVDVFRYDFQPQDPHGSVLVFHLQYQQRALPFVDPHVQVPAVLLGICKCQR